MLLVDATTLSAADERIQLSLGVIAVFHSSWYHLVLIANFFRFFERGTDEYAGAVDV